MNIAQQIALYIAEGHEEIAVELANENGEPLKKADGSLEVVMINLIRYRDPLIATAKQCVGMDLLEVIAWFFRKAFLEALDNPKMVVEV